MARKKQKFKKVQLELRLKAVDDHLKARMSFAYLERKYGVSRYTVKEK